MYETYKWTAILVMTGEVIGAALAFVLICFRSSHESVKMFRHSAFLFILSSGLLAVYFYGSPWTESFGLFVGLFLFQFGMAFSVMRVLKLSEEVRDLNGCNNGYFHRRVHGIAGFSFFWAIFWTIYFTCAGYGDDGWPIWICNSIWLTLNMKSFGLLGHAIRQSHHSLKGCEGLLGKLGVLITFITCICIFIW